MNIAIHYGACSDICYLHIFSVAAYIIMKSLDYKIDFNDQCSGGIPSLLHICNQQIMILLTQKIISPILCCQSLLMFLVVDFVNIFGQ